MRRAATGLLRLQLRPRREPAPARVWVFVGFMLVLGGALTGMAIATGSHIPVPASVPWPLLCLGLIAVQFVPVRFHTEGQTHSIDLFGVPMLVGAVFTGRGGLLLAAVAASLARGLLRRDPVVRILFNTGNQVCGAALSRMVISATIGHRTPITPAGWLILCATMVTYEVATNIGVAGAVSLAGGEPDWRFFKNLVIELGLVLPVNSGLGILAVAVCWSQRWALLLLAALVLGLAIWYRAANRLRTRFADLQSLYGFTIKLGEVSERAEVLGVALEQCRDLLHCQHTELCVVEPEASYRYTLDGQRQLVRNRAELTALEQEVMTGRQPALIPKSRAEQKGSDQRFVDVMAVPVSIGEDKTAVLLAANRFGDETFDFDDVRLFAALAAHLGTALTSSRRLDLLRHEVAAREHEAFHDSLTGLANRTLFTQVVTTALKRRKFSQMVAVMIMDLDGFKEINDTLGHHTGDAILKEIAVRVGTAVGHDRLAARLGGDEFAFVIASANSEDEVVKCAEKILEAVAHPITIGSMVLRLRASVGISLAPIHGSDPSSLLKRADVAMYSAKSSSRGVTVYDPKIDRYSTRRLILASELQRAVSAGELQVWYQPVADLSSGQAMGFEALLRWNHHEYGAVSPVEFIPVAEQTGLIEPLTWFVLREALTSLRQWRDQGFELDMAVNVSARSLLDAEMVNRLRCLLVDVGVEPGQLVLEVTESSMMVDSDRAEGVLRDLANLGVKIAIDDFGTGYSSLSRLKVMPVHLVKVDRSFVQHMCVDSGDEAIVRSTIELARNMGHTVVAEGVEDVATWNRLNALGCHMAQGFLISAAMPSGKAGQWLRGRQEPTRAPIIRLQPRAVTA